MADPHQFAVTGRAAWSSGRVEGSCRLLSLSADGIEIADPNPPLKVGTHLQVTLLLGLEALGSVPVEVVRISENQLGLRFEALSSELRSKIQRLIDDLRGAV